ncbi:DUF4276 family protein [Candidatus Poribacteria bacterium]|nr:DUF4276 family protein [Candidatus Poribacteria bacterium]
MTVQIGCIVEGKGEVEAVPILIRRIAEDLYPELLIDIPRPFRVSRNQVVKMGEIERAVDFTAQKIDDQGAILIILDSDDDCPAQLGPELLCRARQVRNDLPIAVVLAKHEFESWFLAAAESLQGQRGLNSDLQSPNDPEAISGAKEWLSQRMEGTGTYSPTADQPGLTARFDLDQARHADSFDKCYRDIVRLLDELRKASSLQ